MKLFFSNVTSRMERRKEEQKNGQDLLASIAAVARFVSTGCRASEQLRSRRREKASFRVARVVARLLLHRGRGLTVEDPGHSVQRRIGETLSRTCVLLA